jgi:hypothetical protein
MGLSSVSLTSCKAKAKAVATTTVTEPVDYMKAAKIIGNHYNNKSNFSILANAQSMLMTNTKCNSRNQDKRRTNFSKYPISWYNYGKSIDNSNSVSYYENKRNLL